MLLLCRLHPPAALTAISSLHCRVGVWGGRVRGSGSSTATVPALCAGLDLARIHPGDPSRDGELAFSFSYSHTLLVKDVEEVSGKAGYVVWEAGEGPQIKLPTWA